MAELVAKRYGQALFDVALELNKLEDFKEEINEVAKVFEGEDKLRTIFEHPKLSKTEKKDIIDSLFKGRVSTEILNLMYIIVDKGRERYLSSISKEYTILSNEKQGIIEAKAITAHDMSDDEKNKLQEKLSSKFGKKVELTNVIDKSILGGVLVRIEDKVIDDSIKGKLEKLEKSLKDVRIARKG